MEYFVGLCLAAGIYIWLRSINGPRRLDSATWLVDQSQDKNAKPVSTEIQIQTDRVVVGKTSFIMLENIQMVEVSCQTEELRIINQLIYGGKRYGKYEVYRMAIFYKSRTMGKTSLDFHSLRRVNFKLYQEIAAEINNRIGYVAVAPESAMREF